MKAIILAAITLLLLPNANAKTETCGSETQAGDICSIGILEVHPTQFAVGMLEVEARAAKLEENTEKKLKKYLKKHTVPTVIGPRHEFYITDHHHLARALLEAGIEEMNLEIQYDWSSLSEGEFWKKMKAAHLVYLMDENGRGPLSPTQLPASVDRLRDDIYRGLAWAVQKQTDAYEKSDSPYASFLWANFFRARIEKSLVQQDLNAAIEEGAALARSSEAKDLPGFVGEENHQAQN